VWGARENSKWRKIMEIVESDNLKRHFNSGMYGPAMVKKGQCYSPSEQILHDFEEETVLKTFPHKRKWIGIYETNSEGTCIKESNMYRIAPPKGFKGKSEPTIKMVLHTPSGEHIAEFCAVITTHGKMLAHKQTGMLYRLNGECMGSIYMWIVSKEPTDA
jgi:hypothetical protein